MDIATIGGLILGFAMMVCALLVMTMHSGSHSVNLAGFVDPPALMMVFGGGMAVALVGFPIKRVVSVLKTLKLLFIRKKANPRLLVDQLVKLAEIARRDGILALESKSREIANPFVARGVQMAVDGIKQDVVADVLRTEIAAMEARHTEAKKVFDTVGRCGPAFGMIATLLGLVMMLGNLQDSASIGPAMAVALVGTLYGAVVANLICIPMGEKLACLNHEEVICKEIIVKGVQSIQSGDSPRVVEQKLSSYLPPHLRPASVQNAVA